MTTLADLRKMFDKKKPVEKPKPATLGTGYAADAAKKATDRNAQIKAAGDSYKKGGKVKRTGQALLHKNEHVLTEKQAKKPEVKKIINRLTGKRGVK